MQKMSDSEEKKKGSEQESEMAPLSMDDQVKRLEEAAKEKYLYLYSEFENFKKRAQKERVEWLKFGWESIAKELLEIFDNFERAFAHHQSLPKSQEIADSAIDGLVKGLEMTLLQLKKTLEKHGVQEIQSLHQPFNPDFHEAVSQQPSEAAPGSVTAVHSKGYTLHGRLLRPARVTLSSGKKENA